MWELFKTSKDSKKGKNLVDFKEWLHKHKVKIENHAKFEYDLGVLEILQEVEEAHECPNCEGLGIELDDDALELCDNQPTLFLEDSSSSWRCTFCRGLGEISTIKHNSLLF